LPTTSGNAVQLETIGTDPENSDVHYLAEAQREAIASVFNFSTIAG